jgi:hypothetical protein
VASITFDSTSQGILDAASKYRFKSITPVTLPPGTYTLAGYGWNDTDLEHNCIHGGVCEAFNTGGGLLTYIDSPFGGGFDPAGTLPTSTLGPGTPNFFSAANMRFDVVATPEPSTYLLFATGLLGLLGYGWRRKRTA